MYTPAVPDIPELSLDEKTRLVHERLHVVYGDRPLRTEGRDPLRQLIMTILSQRTTFANEAKAFDRMWTRYPSWDAVRDAPTDDLTDAISPATYPEVKAPHIQATLRRIYDERGAYSIDFLRDVPTDDALRWLRALPGVGVKTATLVLLFCFARPVMPVDTHVYRVSGRLGLIGAQVSQEAAHRLLLALLPPDPPLLYAFHRNMLTHGQQVCLFTTPRCERCPLTDLCAWYRAHRQPDTTATS